MSGGARVGVVEQAADATGFGLVVVGGVWRRCWFAPELAAAPPLAGDRVLVDGLDGGGAFVVLYVLGKGVPAT